ncbi:MAG: ribonuclease Y [Gemmatimonadetes bacterium]|jgi:ribonuclease Y|nr:ribonuclease Y [Gemmatimonadota bacterium]
MESTTTSILAGADLWVAISSGLGLLLVGVGLGYFISQYLKKSNQHRIEEEAEGRARRRLEEEDRAQRIAFLEEKDGWYQTKADQEREVEDRLEAHALKDKELGLRERDLDNQRDEIQKEWSRLKNQERRLSSRERAIRDTELELEKVKTELREKLELVANLTEEEAKEQLLEHLAGDVRGRAAAMIRAERTRAKEEADREARQIVAQAIQRCAVEEAEQSATSTVTLPSDSLKSRIIGKEGRNVRTFENATGVKVVVDDTPDTVLLSSFDPLKREVAAKAMARLIKDGGFTPGHIESVVSSAKTELDNEMEDAGRRALGEIGATEYHPELPATLGRLKFRWSYGQNQLQHCLEVAQLTGLMAADIGVDAQLARRAGLLHDIGKTISREQEGSHIELGIEMAERFQEHPVVQEVIAEHHEDHERLDPICFLVKAADAISSVRPGGRRENPEGYVHRIMKLTEIANSFDGVKDVYAINAGREIRVMVRGDRISDDDAEILAFDIAERVRNELTFAGEVKVMVVRETRAVRYTGPTHRTRPQCPQSPTRGRRRPTPSGGGRNGSSRNGDRNGR